MEYRVIPNYENYSISNNGNLINNKSNQELKTYIAGSGYKYCRIINQFGYKKTTIHNLVCLVFLGERPNDYQIDHIDRNKLNNNINNLRYVSVSENLSNRNVRLQARRNKKDEFYNIQTIKKKGVFEGYSVVIKQIYYGFFKNIEDAINKRNEIISILNI
jgi:hypothetical protein